MRRAVLGAVTVVDRRGGLEMVTRLGRFPGSFRRPVESLAVGDELHLRFFVDAPAQAAREVDVLARVSSVAGAPQGAWLVPCLPGATVVVELVLASAGGHDVAATSLFGPATEVEKPVRPVGDEQARELTGVVGRLEMMPLLDVLHGLWRARRTARVDVERAPGEVGRVFFAAGELVHCAWGPLEGEDALFFLALPSTGRFRVRFGRCTDERTVREETGAVLRRVSARVAEEESAREDDDARTLIGLPPAHAAARSADLPGRR